MRRGRRVDDIWEMMGAVFAEKYTGKLYIDCRRFGAAEEDRAVQVFVLYARACPPPEACRPPADRRIEFPVPFLSRLRPHRPDARAPPSSPNRLGGPSSPEP